MWSKGASTQSTRKYRVGGGEEGVHNNRSKQATWVLSLLIVHCCLEPPNTGIMHGSHFLILAWGFHSY